ncbi:MAG: response regulator [Alphaproteobacteria bacterium]
MSDRIERKSSRIFIVDSAKEHREELRNVLARPFSVVTIEDNDTAILEMRRQPPDLVITTEDMQTSGQGCLSASREDAKLRNIPFVVLGAGGGEPFTSMDDRDGGAVGFVQTPTSKNTIITTMSGLLSHAVEDEWEALPELQKSVLQKTVHEFQSLSTAIEKGEPLDVKAAEESCVPLVEAINSHEYDGILDGVKGHHNYTYVHSLRVATFLSIFGHTIGMRGADLQTLASGGLLHDVGKMATPQDILNKNGKLNEREWPVMQGHVEQSRIILDRTPGISTGVRIIALQHHEKIDGSGYPLGLKDGELNELARMSMIVDIFGALTDERSYKPAFAPEKAFAILEDLGDKLDQGLVKVFRGVLEGSGAPLSQ